MKFQVALAMKYMRGRKLRTFLTTLAIIIGVMVIFGMGILLPKEGYVSLAARQFVSFLRQEAEAVEK